MASNPQISDFSPHLFWDVVRSKLHWEKNKSFIVQRVLEYGLYKDWKLIQQQYGLKQIGELCKELRSIDDKSVNFISLLTGVPKESFRCYTTKQLMPRHWIY